VPLRRIQSLAPRVGTLFFLVAVSLVGIATLGAFLGIGFYLLLNPAIESEADSDHSHGVTPSGDKFAAVAAVPEPAAPPTAATGSAAPLLAGAPEKTATASRSEPTPSAGEPASITSNASADELPASAAKSEEAIRPSRQNEAEPFGGTGEHSPVTPPEPPAGQSRQPAKQTTVVRGIVSDVPNAVTWVVQGRAVRLFGIEPGPPKLLTALVKWVRAKGPVECLPQAHTLFYRCFTATGEDIAEAALLAGIGRTGPHATAAYDSAEERARRMGKGLWARH
jgi:endonuclease YncB( thermonuclease family)